MDINGILDDHIKGVRRIQVNLDRLAKLQERERISEALYRAILDEVKSRIELSGGQMGLLMDLLEEYIRLLDAINILMEVKSFDGKKVYGGRESLEYVTPNASQDRKKIDGPRICIACGAPNPMKANYCVSCAAKLPILLPTENKWAELGLIRTSG